MPTYKPCHYCESVNTYAQKRFEKVEGREYRIFKNFCRDCKKDRYISMEECEELDQ